MGCDTAHLQCCNICLYIGPREDRVFIESRRAKIDCLHFDGHFRPLLSLRHTRFALIFAQTGLTSAFSLWLMMLHAADARLAAVALQMPAAVLSRFYGDAHPLAQHARFS